MRATLPLWCLLCAAAPAAAQSPSPPPDIPPPIVAPLPPVTPWKPPPGNKHAADRFTFKLSLGGAYQLMLGESVGGAAVDVYLGAENNFWGGGAQVGIVTGQTLGGLTFMWLRFGPTFEFQIGRRVRLGLGFNFGALGIARAGGTLGNDDMGSPSIGIHFDASVDLVKGQRNSALFLSGRIGGDWLLGVTDLPESSLLLSAGLGYRY